MHIHQETFYSYCYRLEFPFIYFGYISSVFSTQALGGEFILMDDSNEISDKGELFIIPPIMGLSTKLLNRNHHNAYYKNTPKHPQVLRRHGDELMRFDPDIHQDLRNYYRTLGRVDDAMNLGGIKVSATQIEAVINSLDFVKESAAIAVSPKDGGPSMLVVYYVENTSEISNEEYLKLAQKIVRSNLNPLFKVSGLVKIEALPRTASNKVMRRKLRDNYSK